MKYRVKRYVLAHLTENDVPYLCTAKYPIRLGEYVYENDNTIFGKIVKKINAHEVIISKNYLLNISE